MNLFLVEFAVGLGLKTLALSFPAFSWVFTGFLGDILSYFMKHYLNFMVEKTILNIDLGLYAINVGIEQEEYRELILKAHKKAVEKVHTEEEKRAIRAEYLKAIRKFIRVGSGLRADMLLLTGN